MASRPNLPAFEPVLGLSGLGLLASVPGALAQTAPAPGGADLALPEIDVSTQTPSPYRRDAQPMVRLPTTIGETPQSVTVVPREVIQERGAASVREALRNVTGISLAAGEGGFSGDNLTLRGFSARGDFFIDGIRDLGQYTRDPFFIESIEVLKGPASVAFGRGSTGGIINQTTRLPRPGFFGEAWVSGYSPEGARATGDVNLSAGDVAVRMQAMASRLNAAGRDHVHQERWGIAPSVTWGINGPTQLTLSYLHQKEDNVPDYGVPFINGRPARVPRSTFYGVDGLDRETTETNVATLYAQHRFDDRVTVRNIFRWANYDRDVNATAPRINTTTTLGQPYTVQTPLDQVLVRREPQVRTGFDTLLINRTEALVNVSTGPLRHNILAGIEVGRESSEAVRYNFPINANGRPNTLLLTPNYYLTSPVVRNVASDVRTVATTFAAYAVDQIKIGEKFELLLGLRWDSFDADYVNRTATNPAQRSFSRTDTAFSWRTAAVYKPIPAVRTYFAYGTSFNPSAESLTLAANNAALPPEENESYEVGASWEALEGLRLSGSLFRIEKTNARTSDPAGNLLVLDGVTRVDGFEIQAIGRITPNWNVLAGYTHLKSEIIRSRNAVEVGKEFVNAAPNTVALWTTYNLPYDLQLGGGLSFVDYRYGNTTNTNKAPSYTRYDLAAAWSPTDGPLRGLRFQVNALNLFDTKTYETVYVAHAVPGTGRTVVFSLASRF
jgi:catecholate siderophore receptor